MDRKNDRVLMLAVGAVAGIALSLLLRPTVANAQTRYVPLRTCTGMAYDSNTRLLHRCWNDGAVEYTSIDSYDSVQGRFTFLPWRLLHP